MQGCRGGGVTMLLRGAQAGHCIVATWCVDDLVCLVHFLLGFEMEPLPPLRSYSLRVGWRGSCAQRSLLEGLS